MVALLPVRVVELPEHIVAGLELTPNTGAGLTVMIVVLVAAAGQPAADVPFKVYVIVTVGVTVTDGPVVELIEVLGVQV